MYITRSDQSTMLPVMTKLAIKYPQNGLIGLDIAPVVPVEEEEGQYLKFNSDNLQSGVDALRAYGARANTLDWKMTRATYLCEEYTLEKPIDWRELKKYKKWLNLAQSTQDILLEVLLCDRESRIATIFTTTSNYYSSSYYTSLSGTTCWDDFENSDPEANIETAREQVSLNAAEPTHIVIPVQVWRTVRRHPAIRALMKEMDSRQITEDGFPKTIFGLKAKFPGARHNTAAPGATESISRIWSDNVWIGVVNERPNKETMSFAYTFQAGKQQVEGYEDKAAKSDVIRVQLGIDDHEIVCNKAGYLIQNVLT